MDFPSPNKNFVALLGDTHANTEWTIRALEQIAEREVDVVVQLGDFGWWPQRAKFIRKVADKANKLGIHFLFLDGNHEHHDNLLERLEKADPEWRDNPVYLSPGIWHLPRGYSWEWHHTKFMSLGGAYSVDKDYRTSGINYFHREIPSLSDLDRAVNSGKIDVLLSHDYPALGYQLGSSDGHDLPCAAERRELHMRASRQVQENLRDVVHTVEPSLVVHGHWHRRYSITKGNVRVEGLNRDDTKNAAIMLHLPDLRIEEIITPEKK